MDREEHAKLLVEAALSGDEASVAELFELYRPRLKRLVLLRMHPRLQARIDASDVVQDTYLELSRRLSEYGQSHEIPFYLWLRMLAGKQLTHLHRKHLKAEMRTAFREVNLNVMPVPDASVMNLASHLAGEFTSVDRGLIRDELYLKLLETLNDMQDSDREIVAMRNFEELSTEEIATVLGLTRSGVLKRYTRAIRRLRDSIVDQHDSQTE